MIMARGGGGGNTSYSNSSLTHTRIDIYNNTNNNLHLSKVLPLLLVVASLLRWLSEATAAAAAALPRWWWRRMPVKEEWNKFTLKKSFMRLPERTLGIIIMRQCRLRKKHTPSHKVTFFCVLKIRVEAVVNLPRCKIYTLNSL